MLTAFSGRDMAPSHAEVRASIRVSARAAPLFSALVYLVRSPARA